MPEFISSLRVASYVINGEQEDPLQAIGELREVFSNKHSLVSGHYFLRNNVIVQSLIKQILSLFVCSIRKFPETKIKIYSLSRKLKWSMNPISIQHTRTHMYDIVQ